jgi:hypothetical protein
MGGEKVRVIVARTGSFGKRQRLTNPNKIKGFGDKIAFTVGIAFDV